MGPNWTPQETNTHQDHVIAHVLGGTVFGYFTANETGYLLLDIGFIWNIYLDGEMGLVPQSTAIAELELDEEAIAQLRRDLQHLEADETRQTSLERFTRAPPECLIMAVTFQSCDHNRRLLIEGEGANLAIETSLATREIRIYEWQDSE